LDTLYTDARALMDGDCSPAAFEKVVYHTKIHVWHRCIKRFVRIRCRILLIRWLVKIATRCSWLASEKIDFYLTQAQTLEDGFRPWLEKFLDLFPHCVGRAEFWWEWRGTPSYDWLDEPDFRVMDPDKLSIWAMPEWVEEFDGPVDSS